MNIKKNKKIEGPYKDDENKFHLSSLKYFNILKLFLLQIKFKLFQVNSKKYRV